MDWSAVWLSVKAATLSLALITPFGVAVGWLLARRRFPGRILVEALVHAPLVLPPVVTGYFLLLLFGRNSWLGGWLTSLGFPVAFHFAGAVIAAGVMAFPLLVRSVRLAVELVDPALETAAATLGASPWRTFWRVTLPLAGPGLVAGMSLAFARGLGEFGATITLAGNIDGETRTLPLAIYAALQRPDGDPQALRLALLSLVLSLGALVLSEVQIRRMRHAS